MTNVMKKNCTLYELVSYTKGAERERKKRIAHS